MSNEYIIQKETLIGIADEVRTLSGTTGTMAPDVMETKLNEANTEVASQTNLLEQAIAALENKAAGSVPTGTLEITENGNYNVSKYAYADVDVPTGIDTSDATAAAENIEEGKTAYVNGQKITGNLPVLDSIYAEAELIDSDNLMGYPRISFVNYSQDKSIINQGAYLHAKASEFGDATPEDVAEGKTFTSANGLKITGTLTVSPEIPFLSNFQYTGNASYIDDGDGNYRVKFLTSGTLTVEQDTLVDIFAVGGGGNGGTYGSVTAGQGGFGIGGGGGGGGYTTTVQNKKLIGGNQYTITIGAAGGISNLTDSNNVVLCSAAGGSKGGTGGTGGSGGSGGGVGRCTTQQKSPGSDGSNGVNMIVTTSTGSTTVIGGTGQGTTTREFGEETGDLYAGGGGGGGTNDGSGYAGVAGGEGGGGAGANVTGATTGAVAAQNGQENTGGGGGGGGNDGSSATGRTAGKGGSGIVIIRNFRPMTS